MTTVQKGIVCSILLVGLQFLAGCLLQNQSRATASVDPQSSETSSLGVRDRLQDRVQERVSEKLGTVSGAAEKTTQAQPTVSANAQTAPKQPLAPTTRIAQRNAPAANRNQLVSALADQVVTRVNQSSCKDFQNSLNRMQDQPNNQNSAVKSRLMDTMKANPELRRTFIDTIAGPLANKMFDCGLI